MGLENLNISSEIARARTGVIWELVGEEVKKGASSKTLKLAI